VHLHGRGDAHAGSHLLARVRSNSLRGRGGPLMCNCAKQLGMGTDPNDPNDPNAPKKPCKPCQMAAEAIVRATPAGLSGVSLPSSFTLSPGTLILMIAGAIVLGAAGTYIATGKH